MTTSDRINLTLRVTMETGVVIALGFWGYHAGGGTAARIALTLGAPLVAFGFWGAVDFHQAGRLAEPLRRAQELAVSGLAALASYAAGQHALAIGLAALSLVYHGLVYATGGQLLKANDPTERAARATEKRRMAETFSLINVFEVPPEDDDEFVATWAAARDHLREHPGIHRHGAPPGGSRPLARLDF